MDYIISLTDNGIALMWIEHANKTGDPDSYYNVGLLFAFGQGVDTDTEEARAWFEKASNLGHMEAMNNLATIYAQNGDLESAEKWFQKAADLGDGKAQRNLEKCLQLMENSQ